MANNNHFDLTLDTLAPTGSITRPDLYINANGNLTINKGDATYMKVWFNSTAVGTKSDVGYTGGTWEAAAASKLTAFTAAGDYYYHLVLMDSVNNESIVYDTDRIVFDPNAPTASNFYMADPDAPYSQSITNNKTGVTYHFEYSDGTAPGVSGVIHANITGDDIAPMSLTLDPSQSSHTATLDFVSNVQDGTKTINLVLTDAAGNTSTSYSASITLDTQLDVPVITLETEAGGSALPEYINYNTINIHLTDADTGIVGYKVWEGDVEPTDYTDVTKGALNLNISTTLSSGDGTKTFHAKVIDEAGSEAVATPKSVIYDNTVPTGVSVTSDRSIISNISGYNIATLTLAGTDNLGVASYELKCGNTVISSGAVLPSSFSLSSGNSMTEGSNIITLTITDNAGNSSSNTCTVILDVTAPTASISTLNTWYNSQFDINVTTADNNAVSQIWVWTSATEADTTVPAGCNPLNVSAGVTPVQAANINWNNSQSEANYMHVQVMDSVGNVGFAPAAQFGYDSVVPDTPTVSFQQGAYISTTASITIQYSDATSHVVSMRVTGDITDPTANESWENVASPRAVTLTSGDGAKRVRVQVKDNAGNVSEYSEYATCELDTTTPTASLTLYEADNSTAKPAISPLATFTARISITDNPPAGDTDSDPKTYYKLWGDYTTGGSTEPGEWTEFVPDSGQVYKSITGLSCTASAGLKEVRLKVKDSAGHELQTIIASFTYDTSVPEVDVTNVDYNVISKIHLERRTSTGVVANAYADECKFTFVPSEAIQAWKVCAYADSTAAGAGSHEDDAIPQTNGSVNMTGNTSSDNPQSCTIKGADYELALGGAGNDGAHIVVVYVQDLSGQWSAAAFSI